MKNIQVHRYDSGNCAGFAGYMGPDDRSWILFVPVPGEVNTETGQPWLPMLYLRAEGTDSAGKRHYGFVESELAEVGTEQHLGEGLCQLDVVGTPITDEHLAYESGVGRTRYAPGDNPPEPGEYIEVERES